MPAASSRTDLDNVNMLVGGLMPTILRGVILMLLFCYLMKVKEGVLGLERWKREWCLEEVERVIVVCSTTTKEVVMNEFDQHKPDKIAGCSRGQSTSNEGKCSRRERMCQGKQCVARESAKNVEKREGEATEQASQRGTVTNPVMYEAPSVLYTLLACCTSCFV